MKLYFFPIIYIISFLVLAPAYAATDQVTQSVEDFSFAGHSDDGEKEWEIAGKQAQINTEHIELENVRAREYTNEGIVTLTAHHAVFDKATQNVALNGDVRVESGDGYVLETDQLDWNAQDQRISNIDPVKVIQDLFVSTARGISLDANAHRVKFAESVEVSLSNKETRIQCAGPLEIDYATGEAVFSQDVVVADESGTIYADTMTMNLDAETKKVHKLHAQGNVRIVRGRSTSLSDDAVYQVASGHLTLRGNPRVVFHPEDIPQTQMGTDK